MSLPPPTDRELNEPGVVSSLLSFTASRLTLLSFTARAPLPELECFLTFELVTRKISLPQSGIGFKDFRLGLATVPSSLDRVS